MKRRNTVCWRFLFLFALFCLVIGSALCFAQDPYTRINLDMMKPNQEFLVDGHEADTILVRAFMFIGGEKWQGTTNYGSQLGYGTNYENSTSLVLVDGAVNTTNNFIDFQFTAAQANTNGVFFCQVIVTNTTTQRRFTWPDGLINFRKNPISGSASALVLVDMPTGVSNGDLAYYSTNSSQWVRFAAGATNQYLRFLGKGILVPLEWTANPDTDTTYTNRVTATAPIVISGGTADGTNNWTFDGTQNYNDSGATNADHGNLNAASLLDNDHPQYVRTNDTRTFTLANGISSNSLNVGGTAAAAMATDAEVTAATNAVFVSGTNVARDAGNLATGTVPTERLTGTYNITSTNSQALAGEAQSYYRNWSNITNVQDVRSLELQDPTNSIPYFIANPFNTAGTGESVWFQSHGVTGNVAVVTQAQTSARYSYGVLHTNIPVTATGTNLSLTGASLAATDRIGFYLYALSAFQVTNQVRADYTFTKP